MIKVSYEMGWFLFIFLDGSNQIGVYYKLKKVSLASSWFILVI